MGGAFGFGDWDVDGLRVTLFRPGGGGVPSSLWEEVTGRSPESIDSRPQQQMTTVRGDVGGNTFTLAIRPERADWLVHPRIVQSGGLSLLTQPESSVSLLGAATESSLKSLGPIHRLAYGVSLIRLTDSDEAAILELSRFLTHVDLSAGGSDLLFQINRRRRLTSSVTVNRLAKWSVGTIGGIQVDLASPALVNAQDPLYVRKLDLDMNTVPGAAIGKDRVPELLEALVRMAAEIAREGDVA